MPCAPWDALCALGCPVRPGMPPCTQWCLVCSGVGLCALRYPARPGMPCAPCGALCALGCPRALWGVPVRSAVPPCALAVPPARSGMRPVRPCGAPCAPWDALCALGCPCAPWGCPCAPWGCPCAPCGAPMRPAMPPCTLAVPPCGLRCPHAPLRCPLRALGLPYTLRVALLASVSLAAHHAPQYRARLSPASQQLSPPPRGGPLPRPAARQRKSPAAPKGAAGPCSFRCQAMRLR